LLLKQHTDNILSHRDITIGLPSLFCRIKVVHLDSQIVLRAKECISGY